MSEPTWCQLSPGSYTRPLLGSEAALDMLGRLMDGTSECCMGLTFKTTLPHSEIVLRLREAMGRFRYDCPLVAASISESSSKPGQFDWFYSAARSYADVLEWLDTALHVHHNIVDIPDFVASLNQKRLPYDGPHPLVVVCHLAFTTGDGHALLLHGTHAILDASAIMDALRFLFTLISCPVSSPSSSLEWGEESKNLPEGPIRSTGGLHEQHDVEFPQLLERLKRLRNKTPCLGLVPQRPAIQKPGYPIRAHQVVPVETFARVRNQLKEAGTSLTYLLEAATILTVFEWNASNKALTDTDHVMFDPASISLARFLEPSSVPHFVSTSASVAIGIDFKDIRSIDRGRDHLLHVANLLKSQYTLWLSSPHLPSLSSVYLPSAFPSPYAVYITNLGAVENSVSLTCGQENDAQPIISIENIALSHRLVTTRPIIHAWSIRSTLHLQMVGSDVWDSSYLQEFLDSVVATALRVLDAN